MKREGPAEFGDPMNGSCEYSTPKNGSNSLLHVQMCFCQQSCFPNLGATKNSKFMFDTSWNPIFLENPDSEAGSSVIQRYKNLSGTKAQVIDQVMSPLPGPASSQGLIKLVAFRVHCTSSHEILVKIRPTRDFFNSLRHAAVPNHSHKNEKGLSTDLPKRSRFLISQTKHMEKMLV